jgi:hypothetical protein
MHISQKRVDELRSKLGAILPPDLLTSTMDLVCETFKWSPEQYAEILARHNKATKDWLAKKKANGEPRYTEAHKRYYQTHKDQISQKRVQQQRDQRGAAGAGA